MLGSEDSSNMDSRVRSQEINTVLKSKVEIDRSDWLSKVKKTNSGIAELKERIIPIER